MKKKDMHLPVWVLILGIVLMGAGGVCLYYLKEDVLLFALGAAVCFLLGVAAILCWKNQWAEMISDEAFIYSTMFGNEKTYRFSEIREFKRNPDSVTLILETGKVHIESVAVLSERFRKALSRPVDPEAFS